MTERRLLVLLHGRHVGEVTQRNNKLSFRYDQRWRQSPRSIPLSLSMPLAKAEHGHEIISAYMWGLLPDNRITLDGIGREYQVSANNCFALLSAIGEDCPGAVQFIPPERASEFESWRGVRWLKGDELEKIISALKNDPASSALIRETGRFSLPGAQPKVALYRDGDRWGVPVGRTPTTHILKPTIKEFEGQAENEFFCLQLAGRLGLSNAETEILNIANISVICSKRYDRQPNKEGNIVRLHQEDLCQALGVPPDRKYQNQGGPGISQIMDALGRLSSNPDEDRLRFMRAILLNFVLLGTDAHAKNYSLLIAHGNRVRLAPLYDVASYIPYVTDIKKLKMPMKIGDEYEYERVDRSDWARTSDASGMKPDQVLAHLRDMISRVPGQALSVHRACRAAGLTSPTLDKIIDGLWARAKSLSGKYGAEEILP